MEDAALLSRQPALPLPIGARNVVARSVAKLGFAPFTPVAYNNSSVDSSAVVVITTVFFRV